jgi:hypothetical protein
MMQLLKIVYALLTLGNLGWYLRMAYSTPMEQRNPDPTGFILCLLLFTVGPALGYLLFFKVVPRLFGGRG